MTRATAAKIASDRLLLFGTLAGPIAWSVQLMVGYAVAEVACKAGFLRFDVLGLSGVTIVVLVVTLAAALVTLYAGILAYRKRQQTGKEEQAEGRREKRSAFMATSGIYLSGIFLLLILISGFPALVLQPCE